MADSDRTSDVLILQVIEQVEKRASDRETKRFRALYAMVALVSFVGIGVVSQLIELYASRAVDQRLEQTRTEFESAKIYSQLQTISIKLDLSDSFSNADRDTVMRLLEISASNAKLRSEPAFASVLEKIVDSFAASDNGVFVSRILDLYDVECLRSAGITDTLVQHYAKRILGSAEVDGDPFSRDYKRFRQLAESAETFRMKGPAAALRSLVAFRLASSKATPELTVVMESYGALSERDKTRFMSFIRQFSNPHELAKRPGPEDMRISEITKAFRVAYAQQLRRIGTDGDREGSPS